MHDSRDVLARGRLRARRPHARGRARARLPRRRALRLLGRPEEDADLGGRLSRRGHRPGDVPGDHPRDGAPALGPHRRRSRGGVLAPRVPQGAEEPPVACPAARSPARSCTRRTCEDAQAEDAEARLLRLRRRLRPLRDARAAPRLSCESSAPRSRGPPRRAARRRPRVAPRARIVQGEARRYRFVYEKLGTAAFLSHLDVIRALPRVLPPARAAALLLAGLPPEAGHDVRARAGARASPACARSST